MTGVAVLRASAGRALWPTAAWFWALQFAVLNPLLAVLLTGRATTCAPC